MASVVVAVVVVVVVEVVVVLVLVLGVEDVFTLLVDVFIAVGVGRGVEAS